MESKGNIMTNESNWQLLGRELTETKRTLLDIFFWKERREQVQAIDEYIQQALNTYSDDNLIVPNKGLDTEEALNHEGKRGRPLTMFIDPKKEGRFLSLFAQLIEKHYDPEQKKMATGPAEHTNLMERSKYFTHFFAACIERGVALPHATANSFAKEWKKVMELVRPDCRFTFDHSTLTRNLNAIRDLCGKSIEKRYSDTYVFNISRYDLRNQNPLQESRRLTELKQEYSMVVVDAEIEGILPKSDYRGGTC